MNKLRTARLLMTATVLLIIAFQAYWLRKLYQEENNNFKKTTDVIFRDCMYRLQSQRIGGDTSLFGAKAGDNLFMNDLVTMVRQIGSGSKDSIAASVNISVNTNAPPKNFDTGFIFKKDTMLIVKSSHENDFPQPGTGFFEKNNMLNDSIPVKRIDSMYKTLLAKEGIDVHFRIVKTNPVTSIANGAGNKKVFTLKVNDEESKNFSTRKVPVGLANPVLYSAVFGDTGMYLFKKISLQLVLSLFLVALTVLSFVFIYRNLLAQKRLTDVKNEFIGNITHELKTPIATVSVAIEALNNFDALQNPERTKEYLGIAGQELNRLSLLVDKVLRLSMFETQQVELKKEWFDLKILLEEITGSMQLQFQKFGAKINLLSTGIDFMIMADRLHITSVIYNLLDNALKYSKGKPEIDIQLAGKDNELVLTVTDNGIGIPASYKEKIFDKFFRVPHGDKHNVKGYGLGLSYTAHIVAQHNGLISVESEEGNGTTFIINLPK